MLIKRANDELSDVGYPTRQRVVRPVEGSWRVESSRAAGTGRAARDSDDIYHAIDVLQRLTELMERRRSQLARGQDLTPQQLRVLEEIEGPGFMPSLFAQASSCAPAAVSRTLRQLLERDLVAVSIAPDDARKRSYSPTPAGAECLARVRAAREEALQAVWDPTDAADLRHFARIGSALADRLAHYASGAAD